MASHDERGPKATRVDCSLLHASSSIARGMSGRFGLVCTLACQTFPGQPSPEVAFDHQRYSVLVPTLEASQLASCSVVFVAGAHGSPPVSRFITTRQMFFNGPHSTANYTFNVTTASFNFRLKLVIYLCFVNATFW